MTHSAWLAIALVLATLPGVFAQASTPAPGSRLRITLMDAIRADDFYPTLQAARQNSKGIVFKVHFLKVNRGWALAHVLPMKADSAFAEPRWILMRQSGAGEWKSADYLSAIRKYYRDDAEFFGALDMDPKAIERIRKEFPSAPADVFP